MKYNWTDEQTQGTMGTEATEGLEQSGQQELSPMSQINKDAIQLGIYIAV